MVVQEIGIAVRAAASSDRAAVASRVSQPIASTHVPANSAAASASVWPSLAPWRCARQLLILDEAFSGLDVETRTQITSLLMTLQREHGLALLCISHDLEFLAEFAPEIALMQHGAIVEQGCHRAPLHPGRGGMSVVRFVLRRLVHGVLITLGVSVLTFMMLELAPGEFFDDLKLDATVAAGTVDTLRQANGLTQSARGPLHALARLGRARRLRPVAGASLARRAAALGAHAEHADSHGSGAASSPG